MQNKQACLPAALQIALQLRCWQHIGIGLCFLSVRNAGRQQTKQPCQWR